MKIEIARCCGCERMHHLSKVGAECERVNCNFTVNIHVFYAVDLDIKRILKINGYYTLLWKDVDNSSDLPYTLRSMMNNDAFMNVWYRDAVEAEPESVKISIYDKIHSLEDEFKKHVVFFLEKDIAQFNNNLLDEAQKCVKEAEILETFDCKETDYIKKHKNYLSFRLKKLRLVSTIYESINDENDISNFS